MADLRELPLDRFINFIWWFVSRNADEKETQRLRALVWQPPKNVVPDARSPWSAENELKAFTALRAQLTGKASP